MAAGKHFHDLREIITLDKIVGGGQTLGTCADGRKAFVWGGLPGEKVEIRVTKKKSKMVEGIVAEVISPSPDRVEPRDLESYLSTSPWQIMTFEAEQRAKASLITDAFTLHGVTLPKVVDVYTDNIIYEYRNKVEFSWWGETSESGDDELLKLAFFQRGGHGKVAIEGTSLARPEINALAEAIRALLESKHVSARQLKTLLIRSSQEGACVWQLYVKDEPLASLISADEAARLPAHGGEIIYSDPRSPASRITKRLASFGEITLTDTLHGTTFHYATEGFFQVNIPVYERALSDMETYIETTAVHPVSKKPITDVIDMYSGVGTIGLTIGGENATLVEVDENAVREMRRNIDELRSTAQAILAPSEKALEYITGSHIIIVDPPRAGLHTDVVERLLEVLPPRIIYLSCNPVTQARDVALLLEKYTITACRGYNFFPRTPHIEHLVVLDRVA